MLIDIKSYIIYSCFILIGIYLLICYIWRNSLCHSALSVNLFYYV